MSITVQLDRASGGKLKSISTTINWSNSLNYDSYREIEELHKQYEQEIKRGEYKK